MSTDAVVIWGRALVGHASRRRSRRSLWGRPGQRRLAPRPGRADGAQLATRVGDDDDGRRAARAELDGLVDTCLNPGRFRGAARPASVTIELEGGEPRYTLPRRAGVGAHRLHRHGGRRDEIRDAGVFVYGTLAQRTARRGSPSGGRGGRRGRARALKVYDANLRPNDPGVATRSARRWRTPTWSSSTTARSASSARCSAGTTIRSPSCARSGPRIVVVTHGAAGSTNPSVGRCADRDPRAPASPGRATTSDAAMPIWPCSCSA